MNKRNNKVYFGAIVLSIALITASAGVLAATNEDFENNVKVVDMQPHRTHESLAITGVLEAVPMPRMIGADGQITSGEEEEIEPAIGMDGSTNFLLAHTREDDVTENTIPWRFSDDGGANWDPGVYYEILGIESHPAISYMGDGNRMAGTLQGDPIENDGAIQYSFTCTDPTDSGTYTLSHTIWSSSFPYSDRRIPDVGGYALPEVPWWWGMIAVVGTRADPGSPDMPIFNYANYDEEGNSWSSYSSQYGGCENAAIDIDLTNGYYYATFDYLDNTDWDILLMRGDCHNDGTGHPIEFGDKMLGDAENTKYPAVGAHEDQVIILAQSDEAGTQDIICYYSSDAGETWDASIVADDNGEDELYPTIDSYGEVAVCTFIMDGDLYTCITDDGGATWSSPVQVNDEAGTVNSEFRNVDITTDGNIVWADDRNGNLDIYFDHVGGQPAHPVLEIGEITGGIGKVSAVIKNVGEADATDVDWNISVTGGLIGRINIDTGATIASLAIGEETTVTTEGFILGLGSLDIDVVASCAKAVPTTVEKTATGKVLLFFILGIE
jgi:hypothetical protein